MFLLLAAFWLFAAIDSPSADIRWEVCFTPGGACTETIVSAIERAKNGVLVQAYSFTSAPIAKALLEAHQRGVKVEVILDKSRRTRNYSPADFFTRAGIRVLIDAAHAIAHNKVIIIDNETVITGSFNLTRAAQDRNAENVLLIHDSALAARYCHNWQVHAAHSHAYAKKL